MIDGIWYTIARNRMTYNLQGKRITSENLAGQVTTTAWDQFACTPVGETTLTSDVGLQTSSFSPQFDDDCNQTLIKTATGIWQVQYPLQAPPFPLFSRWPMIVWGVES